MYNVYWHYFINHNEKKGKKVTSDRLKKNFFFCGFPKARLKISFFTLVATLLPFFLVAGSQRRGKKAVQCTIFLMVLELEQVDDQHPFFFATQQLLLKLLG